MSSEKSSSGKSADELIKKVNYIKEKIEYYEEKKKESSLALERENAKYEMFISQLKELGYSEEGIDVKIAEMGKEIEDAIDKVERLCSESGVDK